LLRCCQPSGRYSTRTRLACQGPPGDKFTDVHFQHRRVRLRDILPASLTGTSL
jgi:hypothetical protein